jgi:iron complex transport system permease protein
MRGRLALALLILLAVLALAIAPLYGISRTPVSAVFSAGDSTESIIFWQERVPRVCMAFVAGCGLALSGMAFQALFRNPLATPFTLGVASGASLGAAIYVRWGLTLSMAGLASLSGITLFAFAGAIGAIALVYSLTRLRRGFSTSTMLLAGVAVSFFFSSLILFVQYTSEFYNSFRLLRWLMGGLEPLGFRSVFSMLFWVVPGAIILARLTRELDLLSVGDDIAASRGVDVVRTRKLVFFASSLMVGGIVAVCGPIGFVGLMCPHICRLLVGADHRRLFPATLLFGGSFLVICDTVARMVRPAEMPVGIITAFIGGPFFLWLLVGPAKDQRLQ